MCLSMYWQYNRRLIVQDAIYKASKSSAEADVKTNGQATVEDEDEDDQDGIAAGPEMPPEDENEMPDDEDGRFYGGGVNKATAEVLDFIDEREQEDAVGSPEAQTTRRDS